MAKKGIDDLGRVDNGTDIEARNTESEQDLRVNETSGSPEISKAFTESNLVAEQRIVLVHIDRETG